MREFERNTFWRKYAERLVRFEVIAPVGYGKGFPVFLPWGMTILTRLIDVFKEEFSDNSQMRFHVPSSLVEAERYDAEVADFGGYDNIYRLQLADKWFVARPDAAVENLSLALESRNERESSTVLSVFQGFRRVSGATPPLFRDRCIWPFIQLNRIVQIEERELAISEILAALARFFERLCLPVRIIHVGPWKNYARDLYDAVLITPNGVPTILAMFFIVGESYRRAAGIPNDCEAFDVGVTEKNLSALLLSYPDEDGLVLPSALAPYQVVVGSDTGRWPIALPRENLSLVFVSRSKKNWWKIWHRRGVPLILDDDGRRIRIRNRLSTWSTYESGTTLRELLQRNDDLMTARYAHTKSELEKDFLMSCPECLPTDRLSGEVIPAEIGLCHFCRKPASLRFISPDATIY